MAKDKTEELKEIASRLEEPKDEFHQALAKIGQVRKEDVDAYMKREKAKRKNK